MVAACIAASILSYMCIPSVKNMMNKIVAMFAAGLMILFALSAFVVMVRKIYRKTRKNKEEEMKKKFVTLGIMMALSMTVAAGCGQKAGNETTAQETAESTAADTAAADTTAADTAAPDTTGADGAGSETAAAAQSDGSYQYVSPKEAVAAAKDKSAHVLDVREWDNYVKGRVADSMWCPIFPLEDDSLAEAMGTYAKENLSDGQKIYIICNSGKRGAEKATGVLKEAGIDGSLIYTVEGGAKALESEKGALTTNRAEEDIEWKTVAAADALKAVGGSDVQILDVRDNDTYAEGHLKGSLQSSLKEIEDPAAQTDMYKMAKEEMDPSKPVYLLCYSGNKCAKTGISVMKDAGFDVDNLFIIENGAKDKDIQAAFVTE